MPRINFVSFTFLFAFGLGSFAGIALALLAVALARPEDETTVIEPTPAVIAQAPTATPTATMTPTATPTPVPVPRTLSTLQVRIGPDDGYAVLGTLASGSDVNLRGRDSSGDWLAIEFPPGSSARGWIPTDEVGDLTLLQVFRLEVLQASLVETTPRLPFSTSTPTLFEGNDGVPTEVAETPASETPRAGSPFQTPTAPSLAYGPTDLAFVSVTAASDGTVRIVVQNLGPGDVPGLSVGVASDGQATELLSTGTVRAGDSVTFRTSNAYVTDSTIVTITIDPDDVLTDIDRTNNVRALTITP